MLTQAINEMGNRFLENSDELLALDRRNALDEPVVSTVRKVLGLGKDQFDKYCQKVITDRTRPIHEPITDTFLPLFSCPWPKTKTNQA